MKLNLGRRLVLILHWLLSLIACALAVVQCVWPEGMANIFAAMYLGIGKLQTDIIGAVILGIYLFLTALVATMIFHSARRDERGFITVDSSDAGRTRIAVGAVEQMIRQAARGVDGIAEMKSEIVNHEDSISIHINVMLANGAHVPTVTMNLQRAIRSYIELNCGVAVREVCVSVHSLEEEESGKKRGWFKRGLLGKATATKAAAASAVELPSEPVAEAPAVELPSEPVVEPPEPLEEAESWVPDAEDSTAWEQNDEVPSTDVCEMSQGMEADVTFEAQQDWPEEDAQQAYVSPEEDQKETF